MSTKVYSYPKVIPSRQVLIIGMIILLCIALAIGYIWLMTDQIIAPPGLRIMGFLWSALKWLGF